METVIQLPRGASALPETVGHSDGYYRLRKMWLDCRGGLTIHKDSALGYGVRILTLSHDMGSDEFSKSNVRRPVRIDSGAQVYSFAILYNCHVKHHAVVACGSVVRNMTVEPHTMVEGNPARVIKMWDGEGWVKGNNGTYDSKLGAWRDISWA